MIGLNEVKYCPIDEIMGTTIETGFTDYDQHIYDLKPGEITIIVGRNGEGKSTVASQIIAHHINRNGRAYLFSGELSINKIQSWLYRQIVGGNDNYYYMANTKYGAVSELKPEVISALKKWHGSRLFVYTDYLTDKSRKFNSKLDAIFDDMATLTLPNVGFDLFVIDNVMTAIEADAIKQNANQSNLIQRCKEFAINTNTHVIIISHPNKDKKELEKGAEKGNIEKTDISGTNDIPNKADNIIAIERVWKEGEEDNEISMYMTSLKDRWKGERKLFRYKFSKKSLRFYNNNVHEHADYGWKKFLPAQTSIEGVSEWNITDDCPF